MLIGSIEKKYKDQIKDIQETNVAREKEHQKKVRNLEKQIKSLQEMQEMDARNLPNINLLEQRLAETHENE